MTAPFVATFVESAHKDSDRYEVVWSGKKTGGWFCNTFDTLADAERHATMLKDNGIARRVQIASPA